MECGSSLVNNNSSQYMESLIGASKVCTNKIIPRIVKKWNLDALNTALQLTDRAEITKANGNIANLPNTTPMAKYAVLLKETMKAGRLYKNVLKWFSERKKIEDFSYRFTGKESKLFCWHFMKICCTLIAN